MSLEDLDRFLTLRNRDPDLANALPQPMDLEQFLGLAAEYGFALSEADVFAAHSVNTTRERQLSFSRIKPPNHAACAISSMADHHHVQFTEQSTDPVTDPASPRPVFPRAPRRSKERG